MNPQKAVIIGSGVAGLATSIRLAVKGMEVSVYETNSSPGGKLSSFEQDGYRFDAGPSLFTQPENIRELFSIADEHIGDYLEYKKVDSGCNYFYENGIVINGFTDRKLFAVELEEKAGEPAISVNRYLERSEKLYNKIGSVFLDHSIHKRRTWLHPRIIKALAAVRYPYLFNSLDVYNRKQFNTPEARQIFNRFATYNGSNPYKAPAMLSLIPHLEQNEGTFYPKGGMISITNALYRLAVKKGVRFYFNSRVERIIHSETKVKGLVVNNENIFAEVVVSNADIFHTYRSLLGEYSFSKKLAKQERSSSAIIFYWGMKARFSQMGLHNIFFSKDYEKEFDHLFKKGGVYSDPTIYVNITSKMEEGHAPSGCENWFVMVNVPSDTGQDWGAIRQKVKRDIVQKLNRMLNTDIEELIQTEAIADPKTIEKSTGSFRGAIYGTSSNQKMSAFSRPANFSTFARGLYFCGGSVHPGGGIPLCLKSARIVSELIASDLKNAHSY